jgi:hypothetical protein
MMGRKLMLLLIIPRQQQQQQRQRQRVTGPAPVQLLVAAVTTKEAALGSQQNKQLVHKLLHSQHQMGQR